jgi:hypothetical protein
MLCRLRSALPRLVRPTPGISCERPLRSALVSFIPLFGGVAIVRCILPSSYSSASKSEPFIGWTSPLGFA